MACRAVLVVSARYRPKFGRLGRIFKDLWIKQESVGIAESNNLMVKNASFELSGTMVSLSETLQAISTQNEALKSLVHSLPTRIDQLESKVGDVAKAIGEKSNANSAVVLSKDIPRDFVESFLTRATLNQNLLTVACVLSAQKNKNLDISAFCKAIEWDAPYTLGGFLSCMHAIQLCSRTAVEGKDRVFVVNSVNSDLETRAKVYFTEYIDRFYKDKPEVRAKWIGKVAAVEALFSDAA